MKNRSKFFIVLIIIAVALIGVLCYGYFGKVTHKSENPIVTIEVEEFGIIKMELYPDKAPNTVENFIALIKSGYYDGRTFYSVDKETIQAGDGTGSGTGSARLSEINPKIEKDSEKDSAYAIKAEAYQNGYTNNDVPLEKGYVAMARSPYAMDSASSEFFITASDFTEYNGHYAAFGKVIEGMDVVEKISKVERKTEKTKNNETGKEEETETLEPVKPPVMTKVTVEEKGGNYGVPETVEAFDYTDWLRSLGINVDALNQQ